MLKGSKIPRFRAHVPMYINRKVDSLPNAPRRVRRNAATIGTGRPAVHGSRSRMVDQLHTSIDRFDRILKGAPILTAEAPHSTRKTALDALLLALPGVRAKTINGLDAYFISDRMFACISKSGVGLRLPAATAREMQFSRSNVVPFQPGGMPATREWIQVDRADPADYAQALPLFEASMAFVRGGTTR